MNNVNIREWTENDVGAAALIERACFADPWTMEAIRQSLTTPHFYGVILEADGEIVGYACGSSLFEDSELMRIAVLPKCRGLGYGRLLLEKFIEGAKMRGAERMFLEVRASNEAALALYLKSGFQKNRLRKRYYPDGEDGLEMLKNFHTEGEA
jgi:ribosomal-protein-alanine N-acetyltransferase